MKRIFFLVCTMTCWSTWFTFFLEAVWLPWIITWCLLLISTLLQNNLNCFTLRFPISVCRFPLLAMIKRATSASISTRIVVEKNCRNRMSMSSRECSCPICELRKRTRWSISTMMKVKVNTKCFVFVQQTINQSITISNTTYVFFGGGPYHGSRDASTPDCS